MLIKFITLLVCFSVFSTHQAIAEKKKFQPRTSNESTSEFPPENPEGGKEWILKYETEKKNSTFGAPLSSIKSRVSAWNGTEGNEHKKVFEACKDVSGDVEILRCSIKKAHEVLGKDKVCRHYSRVIKMVFQELGHGAEIQTAKSGDHQYNKITIAGKVWLVDALNNIFFPEE